MSWEDLIKQVGWEVEPVECDNYGDPDWRYHVVYKLNGTEVWDDYYRTRKDDVVFYNNMLEAFKSDGFALGEKYYSEWEEENK